MIKYGLLLLSFNFVLFYNVLFEETVTTQLDIPETVEAGSTFKVSITVNKGALTGFSRFTQGVPYGLTAEQDNSANGDFTFNRQIIRLIWLRIPSRETVTFSYLVTVDERIKGEFKLRGKFSYIEENERKDVTIASPKITITPSPNIDTSKIVDIKEFRFKYPPEAENKKENKKIACFRQKMDLSDRDNLKVNLVVYKGDNSEFAKIEEQIPDGFKAVEGDNHGGMFTFSEGKAKILWKEVPDETYFKVSYNIIPDESADLNNLVVAGKLFVVEENKTTSIDIQEKEFEENLMADGDQIKSVFDQYKSSTDKQQVVVTTKIPEDPDLSKNTETKTTMKQKAESSNNVTKQNGVYYKVQVAAGKRRVNPKKYFRKHKLGQAVKMERHEGWYKYLVGSYDIYKGARDRRNEVWNNTKIDDAFVSAYNNGKRITVQEALMITNHKWYR